MFNFSQSQFVFQKKRSFKVVLIGDGASGKTTWLTKLRTGKVVFPLGDSYVPTLGVEVKQLFLESKDSTMGVTLNFWDCAGQEKFGGLRDGYYINGDAAIIFHDFESSAREKNWIQWYRDVTRVMEDRPKVLVHSKCDEEYRSTQFSELRNLLLETDFGKESTSAIIEHVLQFMPLPNSKISWQKKLKGKDPKIVGDVSISTKDDYLTIEPLLMILHALTKTWDWKIVTAPSKPRKVNGEGKSSSNGPSQNVFTAPGTFGVSSNQAPSTASSSTIFSGGAFFSNNQSGGASSNQAMIDHSRYSAQRNAFRTHLEEFTVDIDPDDNMKRKDLSKVLRNEFEKWIDDKFYEDAKKGPFNFKF